MRFFLFLLLFAALGCADAPETPDATDLPDATDVPNDLAALGSAFVETALRNDFVHVHRVALPAGEALPSHEGGPRVIYSLGTYALSFETDGMSEDRSFEAGDVHYHSGGVHAVENTGSTEATFLVFERRDAPLPPSTAQGDTPTPTPGEGAADQVVFDNDFAEVHRVTLQPEAELPPHQGYARAVYSLSGYLLEFTGEGGTREERFEADEAHYHDPGDHTVENAGDTVAEFLVVEFKQ